MPTEQSQVISISPRRGPGNFLANVLKLVTGAALAQVITVLSAPVLSRLYTPEDFGTAALFVSTLGIIGSIASFRYELAIMIPEKDEESANLTALSGIIVLTMSCLTVVLVIATRNSFSLWLRDPRLASYLWMLPIALLATGIAQTATYWHSRAKRFSLVSASRVVQSSVTTLFQLASPVMGSAGVGGLVGSYTLGPIAAALMLAAQVLRWDRGTATSHVRPTAIAASLKRYYKFPLFSSWAGLLNIAAWQMPSLILARFFSSAVVGYYAFGNRLIRLPLNLIGTAIADVFFQRASEAHRTKAELRLVVESTFRGLVAVGLFPLALLSIVGRDLFVVVFGEQWAEAGIYTQILSMWAFSVFISSPFGRLFNVLERQEGNLIVNVVLLTTRLTVLWVGGILGNVRVALWLFAVTGILVYGGQTFYILRASGVKIREALMILLRFLLFSLPPLILTLVVKVVLACSLGVLATSLVSSLLYLMILLRFETKLVRLILQVVRPLGTFRQVRRDDE